MRQGTQWLNCELRVIDSASRAWTEIEQVPRQAIPDLRVTHEHHGRTTGLSAFSRER